jgi:pilus assembly protein CpaF
MILMSGMELPIRAIREQVGSAVHLICQISRFSDGSRKVSKVTEISGLEGDRITLQDIFDFSQTGMTSDGKVEGSIKPTGAVPTFIEDIAIRGIDFDRTIFETSFENKGNWGK